MLRLYAACWTSAVSTKGSSGIDFSLSCDAALERPRKYLLDGCAVFWAREAGLGNVVGCGRLSLRLSWKKVEYTRSVDWEGVGWVPVGYLICRVVCGDRVRFWG
jgi:hypothetical protein